MKGNERLEKFLQLQNKNISFENISKEIGISPVTLRRFLNKMGYKSENGKYVLTSEIEKNEIVKTNKKDNKGLLNKRATKKTTKKEMQISFDNLEEKSKKANNSKKNNVSKIKSKKDRKINITQEDLDKICEVYDWYLEVKDYKSMKPRKTSTKKDVIIEDKELKDVKGTSIKVDKNTWEEFERLCSNSEFSKQQILTQALKDFMKEYKHLL